MQLPIVNVEWLPCKKRRDKTMMASDGSTTVKTECFHISCESLGKEVTPTICAQCPLRVTQTFLKPPGYKEIQVNERDFGQPKIMEDGSLVYPRTGFEPPVVPEGYYRKSDNIRDDGAWTFIPLWPPCGDRSTANTVRSCGCVQINAMCGSKDSQHHGQRVVLTECLACPVRRAMVEQPPETHS